MKPEAFPSLPPVTSRPALWLKNAAPLLSLLCLTVLLGTSGCSSLHRSGAAALQGTWSGREIGFSPETPRTLVISGNHFEYRGANPNDWGKGTLTLRENTEPRQLLVVLTECGFPQYLGKTACLIYNIEAGTLTAAASEPGTPAPSNFDSPDARRMVFKKE